MEKAFEELEKIYTEVEALLKQQTIVCHCCGKCCDFSKNGMRLYIFRLERLYLLSKLGSPLSLKDGKCSGQNQNLCSLHKYRPLGCRTQFCTHTFQEIYEIFAKKIQEIEIKYNIEYEYAEAFES
ncbi:MAG: YkgJ family cysteine cluster protein [Candidatus Brocadiae bacterium]|nr:YkgJ family cysteine cluster protein [Candidatus Brocadiia bacterium]